MGSPSYTNVGTLREAAETAQAQDYPAVAFNAPGQWVEDFRFTHDGPIVTISEVGVMPANTLATILSAVPDDFIIGVELRLAPTPTPHIVTLAYHNHRYGKDQFPGDPQLDGVSAEIQVEVMRGDLSGGVTTLDEAIDSLKASMARAGLHPVMQRSQIRHSITFSTYR